ncbi:unnamed protein product [Caenorhabditis bovis]|uniref:F-box domain-containing protein n=1 Tax=Caenorhabditis bovis TaxID=2654633 RepID=A0A8S1FEE2_9PELO|nr:unnamed protein product [Caenorhabditis bovis]
MSNKFPEFYDLPCFLQSNILSLLDVDTRFSVALTSKPFYRLHSFAPLFIKRLKLKFYYDAKPIVVCSIRLGKDLKYEYKFAQKNDNVELRTGKNFDNLVIIENANSLQECYKFLEKKQVGRRIMIFEIALRNMIWPDFKREITTGKLNVVSVNKNHFPKVLEMFNPKMNRLSIKCTEKLVLKPEFADCEHIRLAREVIILSTCHIPNTVFATLNTKKINWMRGNVTPNFKSILILSATDFEQRAVLKDIQAEHSCKTYADYQPEIPQHGFDKVDCFTIKNEANTASATVSFFAEKNLLEFAIVKEAPENKNS